MAASLALSVALLNPMMVTVSSPVLAQTQNDRKAGYLLLAPAMQASNEGKMTEALEIYQKALLAFRQTDDRIGEAYVLDNIGEVYSKLGQHSKALEYFQQALVICKKFGNREQEGTTLNNMGEVYSSLGKYPKAFEYYQQALAIHKEFGDRVREGIILTNIGRMYDTQSDYQKALDYFQQALVIHQEVGNRLVAGATMGLIADKYSNQGDYQKALEYSQQALVIFKEFGDRSGEGRVLNKMGMIYGNLSQYPKALEYFQQALAIHKKVGDRSREGDSLSNIGQMYLSQSQYSKALDYAQRALVIFREVGNRAAEGTALNNIGSIYSQMGRYPKALEYYQQALVIQQTMNRANEGISLINRASEGISLNNIGSIYDEMRQYPKALEYYQKALIIFKGVGDRSSEGSTLSNIGRTYDLMGQYPKALQYYQQALVIRQTIGDRDGEGITFSNIGKTYDQIGQEAKALEYYQKALVIFKDIGNRDGEGVALKNIGAGLLESNRIKEAEVTLFKAIEVFESLRPGLIDENKVSLFEIQANTYRFQQRALVAQNKFDEALEVSERGRARAFVEFLAARINGTENSTLQLTENLRSSITQIKQIAKERNATLIEYSIINDENLYVWVVQPSGSVAHRKVVLPQQPSLTALVDTSRESIGVRGRGNFKFEINKSNPSDRLKQLHQLLIAPIADLLPTDPNAQVIFVPHGELFLVPFPALQDAKGQYLIEQHTILTAPAIQVLDLTRQKRQQVTQAGLKDVVIVGNPTMPQLTKVGEASEQLKALPGAEREANRIADLFKTKAWVGGQATKAAIVPKLSQARIIHLATHGLLDDLKGLGTPGAIALAPSGTGEPNDGLLTANEILDLKLNAELVVLSACDTGRGQITSDSVIGLSRSLILAGTSSVVVSLWSVPDAPTAELMTEFYQNWEERKMDKAQALRQAMLTIMKRPGATPKDWAAFTLIGESK
jgi:tetratricopeptide (TPR) repeat protein